MDLDGTVLNHEANSEEIDELSVLCTKLQKYKIQSMVATGRTLAGSKQIIKKLIRDTQIPIITYNGSVIIHNNIYTTLDQKVITFDSCRMLVKGLKDYGNIKMLFYYFQEEIADGEEYIEYVTGWSGIERAKYEFNQQPVIWVENAIDLLKKEILPSAILIDISKNTESKKIINLCEKIENISVTSSGNDYIEIRPLNSDKGKAIEKVASYLGLIQDNILAIGDNDNDIEMLEFAGTGVSISSASEKAKKYSDFITDSGAFDGVLEILRILEEINRLEGKKNARK